MPEVLAREGRRKPKALPPDSECKHGTTPQGCPNKGDRKPSWPSRELPHEAVLSTWEGPGPWDPGGKPPREQTFESSKPVRAMDIAAGIDARNKTRKTLAVPCQSCSTITRNQPRTWHPPTTVPSRHRGAIQFFVFKAHREGTASCPGRCRGVAQGIAHDHRPKHDGNGRNEIVEFSHVSQKSLHDTYNGNRHNKIAEFPQSKVAPSAQTQHKQRQPPQRNRGFFPHTTVANRPKTTTTTTATAA